MSSIDHNETESSKHENVHAERMTGSNDETYKGSSSYATGSPEDSILSSAVIQSTPDQEEEETVTQPESTSEPVQTPSISMSAGADPWADPPAFTPHVSEMRKPARDK